MVTITRGLVVMAAHMMVNYNVIFALPVDERCPCA